MLQKAFKKLRDSKGNPIQDAIGRYKYEVHFRLGGRGSRQVKKVLWFKDDDAAALWVAQQRHDPEAVSLLTWDEALKLFLDSKTTLTSKYRKEIARSIQWIAKECDLIVGRTTHVAFASALRQKASETSGRTANKYREHVMSVAQFLHGEGLLPTIPFEATPKRDEKPNIREPFPLKELPRYMDALSVYAKWLFFALAATGERVSALANATWGDINSDKKVLCVTKKGGKRREVPITRTLAIAMSEATEVNKTLIGTNLQPKTDHIFLNAHGRPWNEMSFSQYLRKTWISKGLPHRVAHTLRHMVASELADANMERDTISASLGHEQTSTADIYVKNRETVRAAARGLNAWDDVLLSYVQETNTLPSDNGEIMPEKEMPFPQE